MPSTITLAEKPVALQGVPAPGYNAVDLRRLAATWLPQEGVVGATDFDVTPGAGLTLSAAAGQAGIEGDSVVNQSRYYQRAAAATANITLANPPDVTNPRLDQVILEVKDDAHDGGGLNEGRIRVVSGTPTAGATLDNRSGAAALPASAIRLADVLVPASFAGPFVLNTHVRDRRPWARGFYRRIMRTNTGTLTQSAAVYALLDSANLNPRVEVSPNSLVRARLTGNLRVATLGAKATFQWWVDGANVGAAYSGLPFHAAQASHDFALNWNGFDLAPAAGSHLIGPAWHSSSGTASLFSASPGDSIELVLEELIKPNADNT